MRFLRQATASQSRALGPFVDDSDFKSAKTGLTIANTDIKLVVNGAASANKNSGGGTHRVNGVYGVTFDATDTATVGEMEVSVVVSGALPVFATFCVLEEAVYDALFAASATGKLPATIAAGDIATDAVSAASVSAAAVTKIQSGLSTYAGSDTAGTTTLLSRLSATRAGYLDNLSAGAVALEASLQALITTIGASAAGVATAVWGAATRLLTAGTNIVLAKGTGVTGFTDLDASGVRSAVGLASGNLDTQIGATATASALSTVNANVVAIAGYVDTEVAAIKAKTDQLVFTKTQELDVNVQSVNGTTVNGNGGTGTEWGP